MNTIVLHVPDNSKDYIRFSFEKSVLEFHCNMFIEAQLENEFLNSDLRSVHFSEILKIASWYKKMPGGSMDIHPDLEIPDLHMTFKNYCFEKGDGVYDLHYTFRSGKIFKFHLWEQIGNSNMAIYHEFMQCLETCK